MSDNYPSVHARGINAILQVSERFGVAQKDLLAQAHLEAEWLRHADDRLPVERQFDTYRVAAELTGCNDIGLYVGRALFFGSLNLLLYMSTLCETFRDYLNLQPSILKLRGDIGETTVERKGEHMIVVWKPRYPETESERFLSDEILVTAAAIVNTLCVDPIPVLRADFTYKQPEDLAQLQLAFGDNLHFEQPCSCIYLDRRYLKSPMIKLDYELDEDWTSALEDLFEDEFKEDPFLHATRHIIARALPLGEVAIDKLAEELGVSRRTLQRRLAERNTYFLQVLAEVRSELASRYLADNRLGITEIAFLLGYSDLASFSTAFRGWFGMSPSEYRAR
jgi:AraC-like DNA-binding protein